MSDETGQQAVLVDTDGVIAHWGTEWRKAVGYTADEAVGEKVDLVVPPPLRTRHWRGFHRAIETGHLRHGDDDGRWTLKTVGVHKSGKLVPLRAALELTHADDGTVDGAKGTILGPGPGRTAPVARAVFATLALGQSIRSGSRRGA